MSEMILFSLDLELELGKGPRRAETGREGGVGSAITCFSLWLNLDVYQCNKDGYISHLPQAMIETYIFILSIY